MIGKPLWEVEEPAAMVAAPVDSAYFNGNILAIFTGNALAYLFDEDLTE